MKQLFLLLVIYGSFSLCYGQEGTASKENIPVIEKSTGKNNAEVGGEAGPKPGVSISSAARRGSLIQRRSVPGKDNGKKSESNAEFGAGVANDARNLRPAQPGRPNLNVPAARPTPPVVRPNTPRPNTPGPGNVPRPPGRPNNL
jgi:hypothetical protein